MALQREVACEVQRLERLVVSLAHWAREAFVMRVR